MAENPITIQVQDNQCTVSIPPSSNYRVKTTRAGGRCPVLESSPKPGTGSTTDVPRLAHTFPLKQGDTFHLDVYGPGGEGHLASLGFKLDENGLVQYPEFNTINVPIEINP